MKKFFFFAAALVAAATINAKTYDFATYATEADWVVTSATKNATESKEDKLVYDIQGGVEAVVSPKGAENIKFTIKNGSWGRRFEFYQCLDSHADHFQGGSVSVNDWMYENFTKAERILFDKETEALPELGRLMRQLTQRQQEQFLFRLLYYRYYNFNLDQPFLEQYDRNQEALFRELKDWAARKG